MQDSRIHPSRAGVAASGTGPDAAIAASASDIDTREALLRELSGYAREVGVGVESGQVTLTGEVRDYPMKQRVIEAVLSARDVRCVTSYLTVVSGASASDEN
jgi:osmotically-inducible protein OsmY